MAEVTVPLRVIPRKAKTILAVYARIRDHYHLALAVAGPPGNRRWEPHILVDRPGLLGDQGYTVASGPLVLLKYTGLRDLAARLTRDTPAGLHLPPWGVPAILVVEARSPEADEALVLEEVRARRVLERLREEAGNVRIIEA